jgi:peptide/nickel transport system substrate-binding protein
MTKDEGLRCTIVRLGGRDMASINVVHANRTLAGKVLAAAISVGCMSGVASATTPSGRVVIAAQVTIPPAWLDPSTAPAQITPFAVLYALHEALVRPYPGHQVGPSLAESWSESAEQ